MKQKVVIKVSMNGEKCRSKAMTIAVGVSGVESAAIQGEDKSQIEVIGDGVDAVALTVLLRKKFGHAELLAVSEKKDEEKKPEKTPEPEVQYNLVWPSYVPDYYQIRYVDNYYAHDSSSSCSIF